VAIYTLTKELLVINASTALRDTRSFTNQSMLTGCGSASLAGGLYPMEKRKDS